MSDNENGHDLPQGWVWAALGDIANTSRKRVNPQDCAELPFVGMEHVEAHTRRILGTVRAATMRSSAEHFEPGDVLYGRLRPYLNKVFLATFEGLASGEFIPFRETGFIDSRYLLYFLNSWDFVSFASHLNEGDRPRVDFSQLAPYPFPLAPFPEQHRIVEAIETQFTRLDAAEAALRRVQAALKRYRAAVLKAACEGRLVPTEAELARAEGRDYEPASVLLERILAERRAKWEAEHPGKKYQEPAQPDTDGLPELPEGWCWATVEQLGTYDEQTVLTGPFGESLGSEDFVKSGVMVLTIGCLAETGLSTEKAVYIIEEKATELERYRVIEGDLLFSRMATVGRVGFVTHQFSGAIINYHLMRLRLSSMVIRPQFFLAYVRGSESVAAYVKEVNHGATRNGINTVQLLHLPVALPPPAEQDRIGERLDTHLTNILEQQRVASVALRRAARLRQSILKRAFAGQLVPQDPADEPASALLARIRAEGRA